MKKYLKLISFDFKIYQSRKCVFLHIIFNIFSKKKNKIIYTILKIKQIVVKHERKDAIKNNLLSYYLLIIHF